MTTAKAPAEVTGVTGGVDTHSNSHHAAAIDEVRRLLGTREFPANRAGYRQLFEGMGCYGAGLTRFLRSRRLEVIEVNRPDRRSRRVRGKSDPLDAVSAARRALAGEDRITPKDTTTVVEAIRVLRIARTGAVKSRTAAYNQLKDLTITAPDRVRETLRGKTLQRVAAECARLRLDLARLADPIHATKLALRTIALRVADLSAEITSLDAQLDALVRAAAPRTVERTAQRVLAEIVGPSLRWATARITKTTRTPATDEQTHDVSEHEA